MRGARTLLVVGKFAIATASLMYPFSDRLPTFMAKIRGFLAIDGAMLV